MISPIRTLTVRTDFKQPLKSTAAEQLQANTDWYFKVEEFVHTNQLCTPLCNIQVGYIFSAILNESTQRFVTPFLRSLPEPKMDSYLSILFVLTGAVSIGQFALGNPAFHELALSNPLLEIPVKNGLRKIWRQKEDQKERCILESEWECPIGHMTATQILEIVDRFNREVQIIDDHE